MKSHKAYAFSPISRSTPPILAIRRGITVGVRTMSIVGKIVSVVGKIISIVVNGKTIPAFGYRSKRLTRTQKTNNPPCSKFSK